MVLLNTKRAPLRDAALRKKLNAAIDRERLVTEILGKSGAPAEGPVWPDHWAYDATADHREYRPEMIAVGPGRLALTCIVADPAQELLALEIQRQLQGVGVDLRLVAEPLDQAFRRVEAGDFDTILVNAIQGPNLVRPYLFWHSRGPYNYGHFTSEAVDNALDAIRHAASDEAYRAGVAVFQRAIAADPPAIFLTWSERARAVSARFEVPSEPQRDVWSVLRLWRPTGGSSSGSTN
jgi:peptide/nickel transport system substrate-binding protein